MDPRRFDALAKSLVANNTSRRTVLVALVGAAAGSLLEAVQSVSSTAIGGAQGLPNSSRSYNRADDSQVVVCHDGESVLVSGSEVADHLAQGHFIGPCCPECGSCQTCVVNSLSGASDCGAPCTDRCLARSLCTEAQRDGAYRQLANFLGDDGYAVVGEARAVAFHEAGRPVFENLTAVYAHRVDAGRSGTLEFFREPGGDSWAYAFVSDDQIPLHALVAERGGLVTQVPLDVPLEPGEFRDMGTGDELRLVASAAQSCPHCMWCDLGCKAADLGLCLAGVKKLCKGTKCKAAMGTICAGFAIFGCERICTHFDCAVCDTYCETRSSTTCGTCVDLCANKHPSKRCIDGTCHCVYADHDLGYCGWETPCLPGGRCECTIKDDENPGENVVGERCGPDNALFPECCDRRRCERCLNGKCQGCRWGEVCCDKQCRTNMIACGDTCCPDPIFHGGLCCDGMCVNRERDRDNCGECGKRCGESQICSSRLCRDCRADLCEMFLEGDCVYGCGEGEECQLAVGCVPIPPAEPEEIDFTACETWMSEADLVSLVPDATHAHGRPGSEAENPDTGDEVIACIWSAERNPRWETEFDPVVDWAVDIEAVLVSRGSEAPDNWADIMTQHGQEAINCAPAALPSDATPVCLAEEPGQVELWVRISDDQVFELSVSTTKESSMWIKQPYPQTTLREAAERIASHLLA